VSSFSGGILQPTLALPQVIPLILMAPILSRKSCLKDGMENQCKHAFCLIHEMVVLEALELLSNFSIAWKVSKVYVISLTLGLRLFLKFSNFLKMAVTILPPTSSVSRAPTRTPTLPPTRKTSAPVGKTPTKAPAVPTKSPVGAAPTRSPVGGGGSGGRCCPNGYSGLRTLDGCKSFYRCVSGTIVGESTSCPSATLFDTKLSVCNWAYAVKNCVVDPCVTLAPTPSPVATSAPTRRPIGEMATPPKKRPPQEDADGNKDASKLFNDEGGILTARHVVRRIIRGR